MWGTEIYICSFYYILSGNLTKYIPHINFTLIVYTVGIHSRVDGADNQKKQRYIIKLTSLMTFISSFQLYEKEVN